MKTITLFLFLAISILAYGQQDYTECGEYNQLLPIESTTPQGYNIDIDNDGTDDIQFVYGINPDYGKMVYVNSLQPHNNVTRPYNAIRFRNNSTGALNRYVDGELIPSYLNNGEYLKNAGVITGETFPAEFGPNSTGYFVYRQEKGFTPPQTVFDDTVFYYCNGWIKVSVSSNRNSATVISSCGCKRNNMIVGQGQPTSIDEDVSDNNIDMYIAEGRLFATNITAVSQTANVYNMLGGLVASYVIEPGVHEYDVSNLPNGIYIIRLSSGNIFKVAK